MGRHFIIVFKNKVRHIKILNHLFEQTVIHESDSPRTTDGLRLNNGA
jgi:hypothetical protein